MRSAIRFLLMYALIIISSCSNEENVLKELDNDFERKTFAKLRQLADESARLWPGFDLLDTYPVYLVFIDDERNQTNGYILNPPDPLPQGSEILTGLQTYGFDLVQNNFYLEAAADSLGTDSRAFKEMEIEGNTFFLMRQRHTESIYDLYKDKDDNWLPTVLLHELFHVYQIRVDQWVTEVDAQYYPFTEDVIAYHLLLFEIMEQAYHVSEEQYGDYLGMYVAIWQKLIALDQTGYIQSWNMWSERLEGSARYVEHFSAFNTVHPEINDDPTHSWAGQLEGTTQPGLIVYILTSRMWYHTGAIATQMLKQEGINVIETYKAGKPPYESARDLLMLSDKEIEQFLETAKSKADWDNIVLRAANYYFLINE